jgi:hypothetical protein
VVADMRLATVCGKHQRAEERPETGERGRVTPQLPAPFRSIAERSPLVSRSDAVNSVVRGGATFVLGVGGLIAATSGVLGSASLWAGLGAVVLGGAGLIRLGRAARHVVRFGSRRAALTFRAAGTLGVVAVAWPLLEVLLAPSPPSRFMRGWSSRRDS